jgi:hypothetical protein
MPTEVSQKMTQKEGNIRGLNILLLEPEVKPQMPPLGRDGEAGDSRDSISPVEMIQNGSLSPRRPGSANIGNEQKPTFIEKSQMGSKYDGFFLLRANVSSSSVLSPPRLFPEPYVLVSDNSILALSGVARDGWDDSEFRRSFELPRPPVSWSKDRYCSQKPKDLSAKGSPIASFLVPKAWQDDPGRLCNSDPSPLPFERSAAIEKQSLQRSLLVVPPPTRSCPSPATGSLGGAASPVASGFLKVSWLLL